MQNFSLKVCLRQSKRSQFYDHIVCPFSPIHFKMIFKSAKWGNLVIASNSDPLCSFYKTGLLVFETFCTFSFAITKWPHFYNSGDFSVAWTGWYKQKKNKIHFSYYRHCFKYHCFSFHILLYQNNLKNTLFFLETWYLVIKISRSLNGRLFINTSS